MIKQRNWEEFRESGMLWWINMILRTFGWAITVEIDDGQIINAYPARVKFRGFPSDRNADGYIRVSKFLTENADELYKEAIE